MDMGNGSEAGTNGGEPSAIDFDVFLSFRGPDTRQGFTDCLYHQMLEANIRVFRDDEELHVGKKIADELPVAIKKSKIYIPIFSKGYASSAWCLRELARMVDCKKSKPSEKEIMPIFYNVKPSDVKLKPRAVKLKSRDVKLKPPRYVSALEEHEEKFGRKKRQKWEDALKSVAKIKGWELKKQGYWEFIKSVIREIVMKLKIKDKYVTEHLVGTDDQVEAIMKLLDMDSGDTRFVLIHGMSGIGKSTLAKIVFNKLTSFFDHCCFLENVRESSIRSGIVTLQKQLLSITLGPGSGDQINDIDDGIQTISRTLSNKKVLLVLDDVDDKEQLQELAINCITFGSGSRVIVTTTNKNIMTSDKTFKYEVKPLDDAQSLELFSRHAFRRNPPSDDFVNLPRQIISTAGGLPLTLEVVGSLVYRQNKASWNDVLDKLRDSPPEKVLDKLKISYNALNHEQKQIFLDIACLFVDKDKTNAFYMWKDCGFRPDYSIQVLVCMSLIKITDDNKFWMHDQLRSLGRKIVCGDTIPIDQRKQSRLWVPETANNIIRTKEIKEAIEAICLFEPARFFAEPIPVYTSEDFSRLPNVRFLELNAGKLDGDFENQFSKLRYMTWRRVSQEFLAINFHPRNLVVLQLRNGSITEDWAGWSQFKVAKKLKVLDISLCSNMTRTPNFSDYLSLERLNLGYCEKLTEVDGSLKELKCLIYFNANGCDSLRKLPKGIGRLQNLQYLYLGYCQGLKELPKSFARLTSLVELDLSYTTITRLPNSIGNQKHLSILKLKDTKLDKLPSTIGNLQALKSLFLSRTNIRKLPSSIGNLKSLLELDISYTKCLQLPKSIGDLSRLKIIRISSSRIKKLPLSIIMLKELEELYACCPHLKWKIPEDIWKLSLLRVLDLESTPIKNVPGKIKLLPRLERLHLRCWGKLKVLPELPTSLISLTLESHSLQQFPDLSNLTKLKDLSYHGHDENHGPFFFQDGQSQLSLGVLPPCMSTLSLKCHKSTRSSFHCNFKTLTCLYIHEFLWKEVQLDGLEQLAIFEVSKLELLERLAGLSSLKRLKLLKVVQCPNLTAIQGLGSLDSLEQLTITECLKIGSLDDLSDLKKLKSLSITVCPKILTVKGLDELETLERLNFQACKSLKSLLNVFNSKVPDKCFLIIHNCPNLEVNFFFDHVSKYKERIVGGKRRKRKRGV